MRRSNENSVDVGTRQHLIKPRRSRHCKPPTDTIERLSIEIDYVAERHARSKRKRLGRFCSRHSATD